MHLRSKERRNEPGEFLNFAGVFQFYVVDFRRISIYHHGFQDREFRRVTDANRGVVDADHRARMRAQLQLRNEEANYGCKGTPPGCKLREKGGGFDTMNDAVELVARYRREERPREDGLFRIRFTAPNPP